MIGIKDKIKKSIFWQGAHFFNDILNPQFKNQRCFLWTNVTKYSRSKSPLTQEDIIYTLKHFNVLKKEIELIKPNVVLFFSGKNYDDIIKQQFNKGDLEFNKISDEYGEHEIAQIVSASHSLPIHSYRTYHPRYLRQQKKWHYLSVLAAKIHGVEIKKVLQIQLGDDYVVDDSFGAKNTGITYNTPTHKKFSIRFEFERDMKDFFYGICAKHQHTTKNNRNKITNFLKDSEPQNESWPYWKWFEHRDWNAETFNDIQNGKLAKKIKQTVSTIKEKTEEMQILF